MITEATISHEEMKKVMDAGKLCAVCQSFLSLAWGGSYGVNSYVLLCSKDKSHSAITRHDVAEEKKRKEYFSMDSKVLQTMNETTMLARVEMAKFPQQLSPQDKRLLAQVAITYGFDPLMNEVSIFQGRPFVSIDGRYRAAQETGNLDGVSTRPATEQEKKDWQIPDGDYFFRAEVYVKGTSHPAVGWGRVFLVETKGNAFTPVAKNPQRMAEKRAEAQALRKAFHIPLPSIEDIGGPEEESTIRIIDVKTGEIKEPPPAPPDAKSEGDKVATATESLIDLVWLKESLDKIKWEGLAKYLRDKYEVTGKTVGEMASKLNTAQSAEFVKEVQDRLKMKGG